jgi:hypothetical protein
MEGGSSSSTAPPPVQHAKLPDLLSKPVDPRGRYVNITLHPVLDEVVASVQNKK